MHLHSPHDPHQPLDRRWLRAGWLQQNNMRPAPQHDDCWVEQALDFRSALDRCCDEGDRVNLARAMPAISQAYALHGAESSLLRWAVEARILSGESFNDIARKCALRPEGVQAYEALFFNVLEHMHADTWIACQVIGEKAFVGLTERDIGTWWKMVGYGFGPLALDQLIGGMAGVPHPKTLLELDVALEHEARVLFDLKRLHATHLLPVTPETALQVLQLAIQMGMTMPASQSDASDAMASMWETMLNRSMMAPPTTAKRADASLPLRLAPPARKTEKERLPSLPKAV